MAVDDDIEEDELGVEIDIFVKEGEVFQVQQRGVEVRARVLDYDVDFPCIAHSLKKDADGEFYMEIIV